MTTECFPCDLKPGMKISFSAWWSKTLVTAEVIAVESRRNGVMIQTTAGPVALDDLDIVSVHH